jgi:class 6 POU domain transcription factor
VFEDQVHHATTVDGVNLDEIREFAKAFKLRRLALGLTQTQVGQALSATKGPAYSQSAICRFEKLDITPKSAAKIKPVLEKWMQEAELKYADRLKNGTPQNFADLLGSDNSKKRKRRTSFTPQALEILNEAFEKNTHPSGADMTLLSNKLNYDREVIRVWFCNKRQALKNTIKKYKSDDPNDDSSAQQNGLFVSSVASASTSITPTQSQQTIVLSTSPQHNSLVVASSS